MHCYYKSFFISIFILSLTFGIAESVPASGKLIPLIIAMEATGAQVEECSINAWVKLPDNQLNDEQPGEIVKHVMRELNVKPLDYQLTQQGKDRETSVQAESVTPSFHALVVVRSIPKRLIESEMEYYLVITIEGKGNRNSSIGYLEREIRQISEKYGNSPHITTCLIGCLNGKLRDGEERNLLQAGFAVLDARIIDKLENEHFVSYTGFTSEIREWLQVDSEKINLNMAMHYSQYDNRTYVTIGSPIITREY